MKKSKREIIIELPEFIYNCLDEYGFDYKKNFEQQCWEVAAQLVDEELKNA